MSDFIFLGSKIIVDSDCSHDIKRRLLLVRIAMSKLDRVLKNRHHFADKGLYSQSYGFSNSHVWMWELDSKESWVPKNWFFWTVVLEKTLQSPLDIKEIKPVNPKGNQPLIFIGKTDAEAETAILWPPDIKNWLLRKDPGWTFHGITDSTDIEFEQAPGVGEGQGSMACCGPLGHKESDMTEQLNWTMKNEY